MGSSRYDRDRPGGEVEAGEARALHTLAELVAALPTFSALFTSKYAQQDMMWLPIFLSPSPESQAPGQKSSNVSARGPMTVTSQS
ncbi:MAG: hypothetical protein QOD82_1129, partial [Pseudonocardiales bacterium]|nr:hypothetical protein [Pseudonocardiales bacterium]